MMLRCRLLVGGIVPFWRPVNSLYFIIVIFSEIVWRNYEENVAFSGRAGKMVVLGSKMVFITNRWKKMDRPGEGRSPLGR
jgi:hypothetical protein